MATDTTKVEAVQEESAIVSIPRDVKLEERSVDEVIAQVEKIQQLMKSVLHKDEHYGVIPGTQKPSLLKPGAEKLCFTFRLSPKFKIEERQLENGHREYKVTCDLYHTMTEKWFAQGVGSCSTMESKYRWRKAERECPECGKDTIRRSNYPDKKTGKKGWYCNGKAGGCGSQFSMDDEKIANQEVGRKENPDIADTYNTVLKMAKKRAHVDATITAMAASDIFTQDLDDFPPIEQVQPNDKSSAPKEEPKSTNDNRKITKPQFNKVWATAWNRACNIGPEQADDDFLKDLRQTIVNEVKREFGIEHVRDIKRSQLDKVIKLIEQYEIEPDADNEVGDEDRPF